MCISLAPQDSVVLTGLEERGPEQRLAAAGMKEKAHLSIRGGTDYTRADVREERVSLSLPGFGDISVGILPPRCFTVRP